jgi:hypothetical protein
MIVVMGDKTGIETAEESKAANPYGDVALGVECAWPQEVLATTASEESAE